MGSYKYFNAVYVHILIVSSQCDAVGSSTVCNYQFLREAMSFLIYRAAREITPTRFVICRADMGVYAGCMLGLLQIFSCHIRVHTNCL